MRTLTLPQTDLEVSVIGLGAGGLGTRTSRDDSFRLLDRFLSLGGNFLDTAHIYAAWVPGGGGISERTIGAWLQSRGVRDTVVIGTKGGHPHLDSMNVSRLSPVEIRQDLQESLDRLQMDRVDLYWLHRDDPARPVGEMIETLASACAEGKIRHYGVSNWRVPRIREAMAYAAAHHLPGPAASQVGWSLAARNQNAGGDPTMLFMDAATCEFHRDVQLPVVAYSSQAGGFFAAESDPDRRSPYYSEANRERLSRARMLAARLGRQPNDIALAYLLSQPFPVCALVGCGTVEHLEESCAAGDLVLSPDDLAWLTEGAA